MSGAFKQLVVGEKPSFGWGSSTEYVKSLYLVGRTVLLNGQYYMPLDAGQITWYKF